MEIKYAIAKKVGDQDMKLLVSEMEKEPRASEYGWIENNSFDEEPSGWALEGGELAYSEAMTKWQLSFKEYHIRDVDKDSFKAIARKIWENHTGVYEKEGKSEWITFRDMLSEGISIDPSLVEVKCIHEYISQTYGRDYYYATLKPVVKESLTTEMDWNKLLEFFNLDNIEVTIINPVRKDEIYKTGKITGFKAGLFGGGHSNYKNGIPHTYNSLNRHWIRKPKVQVTYGIFDYGGSEHSDWIDVDNCTFKFTKTNEIRN